MTALRELPPVEAPALVMEMARTNCAERLRARGSEAEADRFERGERDWAWLMRHEVALLSSKVVKS